MHGDYLHHVDLAAAAKARFSDGDAPVPDLKVKAAGHLAQHHPEWTAHDADWDIEVVEVEAAGLMDTATFAVNVSRFAVVGEGCSLEAGKIVLLPLEHSSERR